MGMHLQTFRESEKLKLIQGAEQIGNHNASRKYGVSF
jgi:hypothetical protein